MSEPQCHPPPQPLPDSHYRQIVSSAIDYAIVTTNARGCITSWNRGAERLTGWSHQEMVVRTLHTFFTPEDVATGAVENELEVARREGRALSERWHLRKDGTRFWAVGEMTPLTDDAGAITGFVKIMRDRTGEHQHALDLEFLARSSQELAGLSDDQSALDKVARLAVSGFADYCAVDMVNDGQMRRVAAARANPTLEAPVEWLQARFPSDRKSPGHLWEVMHSGQARLVPQITPEWLEQAAPSREYLDDLRKLGLVSYIAAPLVAHGQALGVITFVTAESGRIYGDSDLALAVDLSQRAAVAIQNARLLVAMREADRAKDVFLATLAHELRNPLAPIWNGLSIIRRVPGDRARVEQVGAMIERQVGQLSHLVDDLLDVSRIATGKLELKKEPTSLVQVLAAAVEMSRPHIEAAHHQLVLTFTREVTDVLADPARLAQVFSNLLNNAAKYTRHGGRIEVCVESHPTQVLVRVKDNGNGIAPDMLKRIFGLFTQIPQQGERRQGGLGIGLSLVEGLVRLHGGRVEARSEGLGQGSEFIVCLPRLARDGVAAPGPADQPPERDHEEAAAPAVAPATPAAPAAPAPARRVLVVDDNVDAATTVADLLVMSGCEVEVAHDGQSAIARTSGFRPDVVLLDIGLPDISGYDAARQIRRLHGVRQPRLIALTGWGQSQDKRMAAEAGFDQHWIKPVDPQRLLDLAEHST